jgi:hypothetical protein
MKGYLQYKAAVALMTDQFAVILLAFLKQLFERF